MKYTIVGDLHCTLDNLDKVNKLYDYVETLGNPVIMLGDTFDTKAILRVECLNTVLKRTQESNLKWYYITGNHDLISMEATEHSLNALKLLPNAIVIDKPYIEGNLSFLPYMRDANKLRAELKKLPVNGYLFLHCDMSGWDLGNGHISDFGLGLSDFVQFKRVISGHYHKFNRMENFTFLGTPFSHSFGESNQVKYIGILDIDTNDLELIETDFPRHFTWHVDCDKDDPRGVPIREDKYARYILTGTSENIRNWPRFANAKYIEKPSLEVSTSAINETQTNEQQFLKWAEEKNYNQELKNLGLEILKSVP
jgi:DNA repair exonuclease SbcCD nuclease subunit